MGKVKSARVAVRLESVPNIRPSIAEDLRGLGSWHRNPEAVTRNQLLSAQ